MSRASSTAASVKAVITEHESVETGKTTKLVVEHRSSGDITTLFNPEIGLGEYPDILTLDSMRAPLEPDVEEKMFIKIKI